MPSQASAEDRNRRFYEVMQDAAVQAAETSDASSATAEARNAAFREFADALVNRPATSAASNRSSIKSP